MKVTLKTNEIVDCYNSQLIKENWLLQHLWIHKKQNTLSSSYIMHWELRDQSSNSLLYLLLHLWTDPLFEDEIRNSEVYWCNPASLKMSIAGTPVLIPLTSPLLPKKVCHAALHTCQQLFNLQVWGRFSSLILSIEKCNLCPCATWRFSQFCPALQTLLFHELRLRALWIAGHKAAVWLLLKAILYKLWARCSIWSSLSAAKNISR